MFKGEMDKRLIFKGYSTHDLDAAEEKFISQTAHNPEFFAVRRDWSYRGNEENQDKVVITNLAGYAGIFIPLHLTKAEYLDIENERSEKRSTQASHEELSISGAEEYTRYCSYCNSLFVTDPDMVVIHCDKPECIERHNDWLARASITREENEERQAMAGNGKSSPKEKSDPTPDFELYDQKRNLVVGWIYFIQAENGLIKIGRSDNIERRLADLLMMSPVRLYLKHAIAATNYVRAEQWLHLQFATKRDHGEWFCLSDDDLEWAKGLNDYSLDRV